jgi:hypothetical protein
MPYSKKQFVQAALEEIGLAAHIFDASPEEIESGVRRLDAMIGEWNARGISLGYPMPDNPEDTQIEQKTAVPDSANEAIITGLAVRLGPSYGKTLARETKVRAKNGFDALVMLSGVTSPLEKQLPSTMPVGAGHKVYQSGSGNPFFQKPLDPVDANSSGELDYY